MRLVLNFSENTTEQQLNRLDEWLKEMGLIESFEIVPPAQKEPDTDVFVEEMLVEAEADFAAGRIYSSDEAKKELEKWLKERK